jgi:membrane-bound lytic murein transglycosylase B
MHLFKKLPLILLTLTVAVVFTLGLTGTSSFAAGRKGEAPQLSKKKSRCGGSVSAYKKKQGLRTKLSWSERQKLKVLKTRLVKDGIDREILDSVYSSEKFGLYDSVKRLYKKNPEKQADKGKKNFDWYSECLGIDKKVADGHTFMKKYGKSLRGAEKRHKVDRRYIASIIGIESHYTSDPGRFKAVNTLTSVYMLVSRKRGFAYRQLKELFIYSEKTGISILDLNSSYAGAIGCAQFIPSSLNSLFVGKANNISKANPFRMSDCIYSVGHYLKQSRFKMPKNNKRPVEGSRVWKAVRSYNRSDSYTRMVIEMAERLGKK